MSTPSQTERFKSAEYAAQQGEYTNAAKIVYDLAIENHPQSLLLLGSLCLGNDKLGGNRRAAGFFLKAADEGSAEARCKLGHLCELGEGVPRDENRARAPCLRLNSGAGSVVAERTLLIGRTTGSMPRRRGLRILFSG
jgi:TPR repeat protein